MRPFNARRSAGLWLRASISRASSSCTAPAAPPPPPCASTTHVDDRPQNCIDVVADSKAKTILIVSESNRTGIASARKLGIGIAHRISDALDILDQATLAETNPTIFARVAKMVGWK